MSPQDVKACLLPGKNKKSISNCRLLKFLSNMQGIKHQAEMESDDFFFPKKIRIDISCEWSAKQMFSLRIKHQAENIVMSVRGVAKEMGIFLKKKKPKNNIHWVYSLEASMRRFKWVPTTLCFTDNWRRFSQNCHQVCSGQWHF